MDFKLIDKFKLFFNFDSKFYFKVRVEAIPTSCFYVLSDKMFYLNLDFGLKYFIQISLNFFFKKFIDGSTNIKKNVDFLYLFNSSLGFLINNIDYLKFDYFYFFKFLKYTENSLYYFFYKNLFIKKINSNFLNLDFIISNFIKNYYFNEIVLMKDSLFLSSIFVNSSCSNFGLFNKFINKFKIKYFYNFIFDDELCEDNLLVFLNLSCFKFGNIYLNKIREYIFCEIKNIYFNNIYFKFYINFINYVIIINRINIKFIDIKLFVYLFYKFCYINKFKYIFSFKNIELNYSYKLIKSKKLEPLYVFLKRKRDYEFWKYRRGQYKGQFIYIFFGLNNYFFYKNTLVKFLCMYKYHTRLVSKKIKTFFKNFKKFFYFFLVKNYFNFFFNKSKKCFYFIIILKFIKILFFYLLFYRKFILRKNKFTIKNLFLQNDIKFLLEKVESGIKFD